MDAHDIDAQRRQLLMAAAFGGALSACGGNGNAATAPGSTGSPATPPPAAAAGTLITTTTLRDTVTGSAPVSFGQVFRPGDLPAGSALDGLQIDVKTRWPDGSVSFGVVSALLDLQANAAYALALRSGSGAAGPVLTTADLRATGVKAAVDAGSFGSAAWSDADWDQPFASWVSGPLMSSWKFRKPIGTDPHLVAWLDVNLWRDGSVEVLPSVENGYLLVPAPSSKVASYVFALGGRERFRQTIELLHHQRTPLLSGTATSHWLGAAHDVTVKHDAAYLQATGLVPTYQAVTPVQAARVRALPTSFVPLQQGSFPLAIGTAGYSPSIGLLPEWDVLYLTCSAPETFKGVVFNGYSAGRYGFHFRDETNPQQAFRPPRISRYSTLTVMEPSPGWTTPPQAGGAQPPAWPSSHQPSMGYLAYLVTGRQYFLEELQFLAAANALAAPNTWREGVKGLFKTEAAGSVRGVAWRWRTLAQAVAATPDDDTVFKAEFAANLRNNIEYYHGRYVLKPSNPLGFVTPYSDYNGLMGGQIAAGSTAQSLVVQGGLYGAPYNETADDQYVGWKLTIGGETRTVTSFVMSTNVVTVAPPFSRAPAENTRYTINDDVYFDATWMQAFFTAALGYAKDLATALDGTTRSRLDALFAWNAPNVIGQFGTAAEGDFLFRDAAPYSIAIAPSETPDFEGGGGPWYSNWGQVYRATFGGRSPLDRKPPPYVAPGPKVDGPLRMGLNADGYLANALPALAYAVRHQVAGAQAAYQRLSSASNWSEFVQGLQLQPVWAVAPGVAMAAAGAGAAGAAAVVPPAWNRGQAAGEWRELPGSNLSAQVPTNVALTLSGGAAVVGPRSRLDAWCGLSIDTRSSEVWAAANGGHGDYYGNEVVKIALMADQPAWVEWFAGSNGKVVDNVTAPSNEHPELGRYKDGLPTSAHSYYGQQFIERHDRALRLGGSMSPYGSGWQDVEAFNVKLPQGTNGWDAAGTYPPVFGAAGWTLAIGFCVCKDPSTERLYVVQAPSLRRFTPAAAGVGGRWEVMGPLPAELNSGAMAATAVDTKRGRLLWLRGYGPKQPYTCDLATGTWTARTHPSSAARPAFDALLPSLGMVYVPHLDAFLVRGTAAGAAVFRIDADTLAVTLLATRGGSAIERGPALSGEEGVYNRWLWVPALRGVVYFPHAGSNAWFLQL
ncbi:MAG: hypothetical protein LCI02_07150 [Proteobacteria bacterium]|nr:hypothetical protein [Pseudomonadota bacterium]